MQQERAENYINAVLLYKFLKNECIKNLNFSMLTSGSSSSL